MCSLGMHKQHHFCMISGRQIVSWGPLNHGGFSLYNPIVGRWWCPWVLNWWRPHTENIWKSFSQVLPFSQHLWGFPFLSGKGLKHPIYFPRSPQDVGKDRPWESPACRGRNGFPRSSKPKTAGPICELVLFHIIPLLSIIYCEHVVSFMISSGNQT